jgi:hypothetical protein
MNRDHGRDDQGAPSPSEVAGRIAGVRSAAFDLVGDLHRLDRGRWAEFGRAGETMQSIANQLADVEWLVDRGRSLTGEAATGPARFASARRRRWPA